MAETTIMPGKLLEHAILTLIIIATTAASHTFAPVCQLGLFRSEGSLWFRFSASVIRYVKRVCSRHPERPDADVHYRKLYQFNAGGGRGLQIQQQHQRASGKDRYPTICVLPHICVLLFLKIIAHKDAIKLPHSGTLCLGRK